MRRRPILAVSPHRQPVSAGSQPAVADQNQPIETLQEPAMNVLKTLFSSLILTLALAGAAIAGETVNINTADAATIDRVLVNVGPAKAQAIVDYRKANGAFKSAEQLAMVKGIGLKTVEKNRDRIALGGARPASKAGAKPAAKPMPKQVARR